MSTKSVGTRAAIAKEPYDYGHADTAQVRCPDYRGFTRALITLDERTQARRSRAMPDKASGTVWKAYARLLPGNRMETNPHLRKAFGVLSVDGGKEFEGEFLEGCRARGTEVRVSAPRRSQSNSIAERAVQEWQRDASAALKHACAPLSFWSMAAEHMDRNIFCS